MNTPTDPGQDSSTGDTSTKPVVVGTSKNFTRINGDLAVVDVWDANVEITFVIRSINPEQMVWGLDDSRPKAVKLSPVYEAQACARLSSSVASDLAMDLITALAENFDVNMKALEENFDLIRSKVKSLVEEDTKRQNEK